MDKHRIAFRRALEKQGTFSSRTIESYVAAAGRVVRLCKERDADLYAGEVPDELLDAITEGLPTASVRRVVRGAVLFMEFLHGRGIPVPLEGAEAALSKGQLRRFLDAAAEQREPYATFLRLLPTSGLSAQDLARLELDDVTQDERGVALRLSTDDVCLGAEAERALLRFLHGWRSKNVPDSTVLFPSREGRALSSSTITRRLRSVQKAADLPAFRISALSELFPIYFQAPAIDDAPEPEDEGVAEVALGPPPDGRQPDLPHTAPSLGALPPDDDDEDPGPRLRLVPSPPHTPPEPEPPRTSSSPTQTTHTQEDAPVDNDDDDFEDDMRRPPAPPPSRRRSRAQRDRGRPSTSQPHPNLRKLLGQQGTVYIRRRTSKGRLADIGLFSLVDIGTDRSINTFIIRQLVPTYGPGDYEVYLNPTDTESYLTVPVAEPLGESASHAPLSGGRRGEPGPSSMGDLWDIIRYFDERERERPSERQSFREFYEQMKLKEELEALRRENARLAAGGGPTGAALPPLPVGGPALAPSMSDQLAERYLKFLESQAAAAQTPSGPFDNLDEVIEFKRKLEAVGLEFGGNSAASERDFLDRMNEFLNSPFGQMVAKRMLGPGMAPSGSPRRDRGLRDAPPNKRRSKKSKKKSKSKPRRPKAQPPRNDNGGGSERERAPERERAQPRWAPSGVPEHFPSEALEQAQTHDEIREALILVLMCLNFDARWHDAVQALLEATVADEREEALAVATSIAGALIHLGELERETAQLALQAVDQEWSTLRARVLAIAAQEGGPPAPTEDDEGQALEP